MKIAFKSFVLIVSLLSLLTACGAPATAPTLSQTAPTVTRTVTAVPSPTVIPTATLAVRDCSQFNSGNYNDWRVEWGTNENEKTVYSIDSSIEMLHRDHLYIIEMTSVDDPDTITVEVLRTGETQFYEAILWDCGPDNLSSEDLATLLASFKQ